MGLRGVGKQNDRNDAHHLGSLHSREEEDAVPVPQVGFIKKRRWGPQPRDAISPRM